MARTARCRLALELPLLRVDECPGIGGVGWDCDRTVAAQPVDRQQGPGHQQEAADSSQESGHDAGAGAEQDGDHHEAQMVAQVPLPNGRLELLCARAELVGRHHQ